MSSEEGRLESEEPLDGVNEQTKVDDKENNNGLSAAQPTAIRYRKQLILSVHAWLFQVFLLTCIYTSHVSPVSHINA